MKRFTVVMSDRLVEKIQNRSDQLELSKSDLIRLILNESLGVGGVANENQA